MMPEGDLAGGPVNTAIPVTDTSQIGEARRAALVAGDRAALSSDELGRLGLIVTEAATNLARHARDGMIVLRNVGSGGNAGVEVVALDRGPGITDLAQAMEDGFSTAGTPGKGLGAIRRLARGRVRHPLDQPGHDDDCPHPLVPRARQRRGRRWRDLYTVKRRNDVRGRVAH